MLAKNTAGLTALQVTGSNRSSHVSDQELHHLVAMLQASSSLSQPQQKNRDSYSDGHQGSRAFPPRSTKEMYGDENFESPPSTAHSSPPKSNEAPGGSGTTSRPVGSQHQPAEFMTAQSRWNLESQQTALERKGGPVVQSHNQVGSNSQASIQQQKARALAALNRNTAGTTRSSAGKHANFHAKRAKGPNTPQIRRPASAPRERPSSTSGMWFKKCMMYDLS